VTSGRLRPEGHQPEEWQSAIKDSIGCDGYSGGGDGRGVGVVQSAAIV